MSAGKSQDAATANTSGCFSRRSAPPIPDLENPISQFWPPPANAANGCVAKAPAGAEKFWVTHGTRSLVMKVSYRRLGSFGLSAYQGSIANEGSMIVRLYWS